jgi:acyl-CoA synthetase (NDP forming)
MRTDPDTQLRNERRRRLARILQARTVVFIGGRVCAAAIDYCRALGFAGEIFVVNPIRDEIGGIACVRDLGDLPKVPDVAWIALRPEETLMTVRKLAQMGVAGAVCFGAGYAEGGHEELQGRLVQAAGNMALLGPNTLGFVNFADRVAVMADSHGTEGSENGIAVISQSGTFGANLALSNRTLPISHIVSLGNQACIDTADAIEVLCDDPRVVAFALYVEGISNPVAFAAAAVRAFQAKKPIICLHAGKSTAGSKMALSHTAALSGEPEAAAAFYRRLGIVQAPSFPILMETAKLFASERAPKGRQLVIETASGMDAIYCADLADANAIVLPQPSEPALEALSGVLPDIATPSNPLDVTMALWGDRQAQADAMVGLAQTGCDMAAIVVNAPSKTHVPSFLPAFQAAADAQAALDVPCYVLTNLPEGLPKEARAYLAAAGCIVLQGLEDAFVSLSLACSYAEQRVLLDRDGGPDDRIVATRLCRHDRATSMSEPDSKALLARVGVAVPASAGAATTEEAVQHAERIGYPVVLKSAGASLQHKTEKDAVVLSLRNAQSVRAAADRLLGIAGSEGLLVEEMIEDTVAEVIVGVTRDPVLGLKLTIGAGGVLTELLDDAATLILPARRSEIKRAIRRLRIAKIIDGWRGKPAGDFDALVDLVEHVAAFAVAHADSLSELDLNPVLVRPEGRGAVAVDALVINVEKIAKTAA